MNAARLEKSIRLLRELNQARLDRHPSLISKYESLLRQHDYDSRDKINMRQTTIFDKIFGASQTQS